MVHSKHYYIGLVKKALFYVLVVILCAIFLSPFIIMFTTSMKTNYDAFQIPVQLLPRKWIFTNYSEALAKIPYIKYMMNTIFITALSVLGSMFATPMVAYSPAPSILAASIRELGRPAKNWRMMMIKNGVPKKVGTISGR